MILRTEVTIPKYPFVFHYSDPVVTIGSCFTENIGAKLSRLGFDIDINPFGIIFNPVSLFNGVDRILKNEEFNEADLFEKDGLWHSWMHHGSYSSVSASKSLNTINSSLEKAHDQILNSKFLFITMGTAWVYEHKEAGIVANCHKVPNTEFSKRLLSVDEITEHGKEVLQKLTSSNPDINVLFTISPVRHWKDGAQENALSKAVLRTAIHQLYDHNHFQHYFPAYELMMDDLRDYRFYSSDMLHPSPVAIEYIWQKFSDSMFDEKTQELLKQMDKLLKAKEHRSIHTDTDNSKIQEKEKALRKKLGELLT